MIHVLEWWGLVFGLLFEGTAVTWSYQKTKTILKTGLDKLPYRLKIVYAAFSFIGAILYMILPIAWLFSSIPQVVISANVLILLSVLALLLKKKPIYSAYMSLDAILSFACLVGVVYCRIRGF